MPEQNQSIAEQIDADKIQSVSSNGVSVTLKGASDRKMNIEADILESTRGYNPLKSCFRADGLGSMRR